MPVKKETGPMVMDENDRHRLVLQEKKKNQDKDPRAEPRPGAGQGVTVSEENRAEGEEEERCPGGTRKVGRQIRLWPGKKERAVWRILNLPGSGGFSELREKVSFRKRGNGAGRALWLARAISGCCKGKALRAFLSGGAESCGAEASATRRMS